MDCCYPRIAGRKERGRPVRAAMVAVTILSQMVRRSGAPLGSPFSALADPTRRAIVERLTRGTASVGELAEPFDMSLPAVSKHLSVLEGAGLVVRTREGRVRTCELVEEPLHDALRWIATYGSFWEGQTDSLERLLSKSGRSRKR